MRPLVLTVSAIAMSLVAIGASAQAATWSAGSGPSLFRSLGITIPSQQARSQIITASVRDFTVVQYAPLQTSPSLPTVWNLSITPLSSDRVPAVDLPPAPPPRASFVPQIAQQGGGADPLLLAQLQQVEAVAKMPVPTDIPVPTNIPVPASAYWGEILGRYTSGDNGLTRFDYAGLKASADDTANLGKYIEHMAAQKPSDMPRSGAMAYWANLYNALTVQVVAENYPVKSIRKIKSGFRPGPWKRDLVVVEGRTLSLDNIEHDIMRPSYQTPLVHYMVNCAAVGCPNLKTTPWQGAGLAAEQEAYARAYINSPRGAKIENGRLQVSSIYKWFKKDFGGNEAGVLAHLRQYADADLRAGLEGRTKIDKYAYDWDVNAPK